MIEQRTWNVHEKFETIEFKRLRVKKKKKEEKKRWKSCISLSNLSPRSFRAIWRKEERCLACAGVERWASTFPLDRGGFSVIKCKENRARGHTDRHPHWQPSFKLESWLVEGRGSPTLYPTWPPTRTREITTTLPPFPGFARRSQHTASSFPSSNLSILSSSK